MSKTRLKVRSSNGNLVNTYEGQSGPQDRYIEVDKDGLLYITWNAEIGNAVPARIWHNIERRIRGNWRTKAEAKQFIAENRASFERLVSGMSEEWDGNNYIGTLTEDAAEALENLKYNSSDDGR